MNASDTNVRLGEMLVRSGKLKNEQVQEALKKLSTEKHGSLLTALMDLDHLPFSTVAQFVEKILSMKTYAIGGKTIDAKVLALVNQKTIETEFVFPIGLKRNKSGQEVLVVGIVDPLAQHSIEMLEKEVGKKIFPVLISKPDFVDALNRHFKNSIEATVRLPSQTVSVTVDSKQLPPLPGAGADTQKIEMDGFKSTDRRIELAPSHSPFEIEASSHGEASPKTGTFDFSQPQDLSQTSTPVGDVAKRFKEEALVKLDLTTSETKLFGKETYTRELLIQELAQISLKSLQSSTDDLSTNQKLEAIVNLLLSKKIVTQREVYTQYAVSKVFSPREKSKKDSP